MTDRFHSLTVILENITREDDAESIISAIKQIRGVIGVGGNVADMDTYSAYERARWELKKKLFDALEEET